MDRPKRPAALNATAELPPQPRVDLVGEGGDRVRATLPTGDSVEVLLAGATVISWKTGGDKGQEQLWLSEGAVLDGSKAVRGGIPLVFPVFGVASDKTHPTAGLPQHGLARTSRWDFLGKSTTEAEGEAGAESKKGGSGVQLDFGLSKATANPTLTAKWPKQFSLVYRVTLEPDKLTTGIVVTNDGDAPFAFQVLLHTYLRVAEIEQVAIVGLGDGTVYVDKVGNDAPAERQQTDDAIVFSGETDRVYSPKQGSSAVVTVEEPKGTPRFVVTRDNLDDVVVWNPWTAKAGGMADFAPKTGFHQMVCVEAGAVSGWTTLEAGDAFEGQQTITAKL